MSIVSTRLGHPQRSGAGGEVPVPVAVRVLARSGARAPYSAPQIASASAHTSAAMNTPSSSSSRSGLAVVSARAGSGQKPGRLDTGPGGHRMPFSQADLAGL